MSSHEEIMAPSVLFIGNKKKSLIQNDQKKKIILSGRRKEQKDLY